MKSKEIAQWVITNRYPQIGKERMTDTEMFHLLNSKIKETIPTEEEWKEKVWETAGETDKLYQWLKERI